MKAKKILLGGVAALSCAALIGLTSCTTVSITTLVPNWYENTTLTSSISDTKETLVYEVSYQKGSNSNYSVEYQPGTYTVTLQNDTYNGESVYKLTSSLTVSGTYAMGSESLDFSDSVESVCYFRDVSRSLYPLYSEKTVRSTSPLTDDPASLEEAVRQYNYSVTVTYSTEDNGAVSVYKDLSTNETQTHEYSLRDNMTVLDNETLLFAARGLSLSVGGSANLYVVNPYTQTQEVIAVNLTAQTANAAYTFIDVDAGETEATEHKITANTLVFSRDTTLTGGMLTARYAAAPALGGENPYRCVMLEMSDPLSYNMGSLVYRLTKADFTDK